MNKGYSNIETMKIIRYVPILTLLFALNSCESDRSACDCYKTADEVKDKISKGEISNKLSEEELQQRYMKGCEWIKEADESVVLDDLSDCPKYKKRFKEYRKTF